MNIANEYVPQGPRDQESQKHPSEQQGVEQDRPDQQLEDPRLPTVTPESDHGIQNTEPQDRDHQQMTVPSPKEEDEEDEERDEEKEMDEGAEDVNDDELDEDEDEETERDKNTTAGSPSDDFQYPSNNPWETNPEDPAQNRKTDPMTDHESRVPGI